MEQSKVAFGNSWVSRAGLVDLRRPARAADAGAIADRLAITEIVHSYGWSVDERRMDMFADMLTEDATFDIVIADGDPVETPSGREAIVSWMSDYMDALDFQMRHRMGNVLVTAQDGDTATAISYLFLTSTTPERVEPMATAVYTWNLAREDDTWRVSHISAAFDRTFA